MESHQVSRALLQGANGNPECKLERDRVDKTVVGPP